MLDGPMELLELADGESLTFHVEKWERADTIIKPKHAPQGKVADTLRVYVPPADKRFFPHYWDITAKRAIAQLIPHLQRPGFEKRTFKLTKHGEKPTAHFDLEVT